jgi:mono/diheme cytochrome c family protein
VTARLATAAAIAIGLAASEGSSKELPYISQTAAQRDISQTVAQRDIPQAVGQSFSSAPGVRFANVQSSAQSAASVLPDAAGVEVARAKCIGCHEADLIVSQRLSPTGWDREVAKMERWGAKLSAEERPLLVSYLTRQFGLRPVAAHDAAAVVAGEAIYKQTCRTCHEDDLSEQQRLSAAAWGRTVDKMVRWGAKVSADEKPALVAYLTSRWGHP